MLRAVSRLAPYLESYDYCSTGSQIDDANTHEYLGKITDIAKVAGKFDEGVLFRGENANVRSRLVLPKHNLIIVLDLEGGIQDTFPQCHPNHGLCRMRQMSFVG